MPIDEPITNAELARRLDDRFRDLRDDLRDLDVKVEKLVPREVYDAHRAANSERVNALEQSIISAETRLAQRITALETRTRWLIASVLVPVGLFVLTWVLTAKGVKP